LGNHNINKLAIKGEAPKETRERHPSLQDPIIGRDTDDTRKEANPPTPCLDQCMAMQPCIDGV